MPRKTKKTFWQREKIRSEARWKLDRAGGQRDILYSRVCRSRTNRNSTSPKIQMYVEEGLVSVMTGQKQRLARYWRLASPVHAWPYGPCGVFVCQASRAFEKAVFVTKNPRL